MVGTLHEGSALLRSALKIALVVGLMSAFAPAHALDESLSFRPSPIGGIEAVVSGRSDGPGCEVEFLPPSSIEVDGTSISIASPYDDRGCFLPMAPVPYEVVAELGVLAAPSYDVTWTQNSLELHGTLVPGSLAGGIVALPMLSPAALIVLGLLLWVAGLVALPCYVSRRSRLGQIT